MTATLRGHLRLVLALLCPLVLADIGSADPLPDPALWGGGHVNPNSGMAFVPLLFYNEVLDELYINTLGVNQINDTGSNSLILGDDGLFFSAIIDGSVTPTSILLNNQSLGGLFFLTQFFSGRLQINGLWNQGPYSPLPTTLVARYPDGTTCGNFGSVDMVPFYGNVPGGFLLGGVQCVPEPIAISTTLLAGMVVIHIARRSLPRKSVTHA